MRCGLYGKLPAKRDFVALSAPRGFFGSRPYSRVNALLAAQGAEPIDWSLP